MTESEDERILQCWFCGSVLSKDADNSSASFCGNINCPFSGIDIYDEWWQSSYCSEQIDLLTARIKELEGALEKAQQALIDYEMDVDDAPPYRHRKLMNEIAQALAKNKGEK